MGWKPGGSCLPRGRPAPPPQKSLASRDRPPLPGLLAPPQARRTARQTDSEDPPIPITVRQLEALVRISEALARMEMCGEVGTSATL